MRLDPKREVFVYPWMDQDIYIYSGIAGISLCEEQQRNTRIYIDITGYMDVHVMKIRVALAKLNYKRRRS